MLCCSYDCTSNRCAVAVSCVPLTVVHTSTKTFSESSLSPSFSSQNRNLDGTAFGNHLGIYPTGFPLLNFVFCSDSKEPGYYLGISNQPACNQVLKVEVNKRLRLMWMDNSSAAYKLHQNYPKLHLAAFCITNFLWSFFVLCVFNTIQVQGTVHSCTWVSWEGEVQTGLNSYLFYHLPHLSKGWKNGWSFYSWGWTWSPCTLNKGGEKVLALLQPTHGAVTLL